jgi:hypothetical protein
MKKVGAEPVQSNLLCFEPLDLLFRPLQKRTTLASLMYL